MNREMFWERVTHGTLLFPVAVYTWEGEFEYTVNMHWHKEIEIIYFEKGSFAFCRDGIAYTVQGPALSFIDAEMMHSLTLCENERQSALVFDCKMLSYELYDHSQSTIIEPLINHKLTLPPFLYPQDSGWEEVISLYKKAVHEYQKGTAGSHLRVKLYLTELFSLLYDNGYLHSAQSDSSADKRQSSHITKALAYIRDNYSAPLKSYEVANHVGMNEQYFCRYFHKKTGKTLTEYINQIRVDRASEMLTNTDEKIIDIAIECGYNNISYFIKRFKNIKGITPQEYRRNVKSSVK